MLGFNDENESSSSSEEVWRSFLLNNPRYASPRNAQQWSSPAELLPELDVDLHTAFTSDDDEDSDNDSLLSTIITGLVQNDEVQVAEWNTRPMENFERFTNNVSNTPFWRCPGSPPVSSSSESSESFGCLLESKEESEEEVWEYKEEDEEVLSDLLSYDLWTDELIDFTEELYNDEAVQEPVVPEYEYGSSEEEESDDPVVEEELNFSNQDADESELLIPVYDYSSGQDQESDYIEFLEEASQIDSDSANSYTTAVEDENYDPAYQMVVGRSLFEEWLLLREGELLKEPESISLLCIIRDTVLSPVATLLVKFNAPSDWRSCRCCGGFIETHCCLFSHEESDDEGVEDQNDDFPGLQLFSNDEDGEELEDFTFDFSLPYSLGHVGHDQLMSFIHGMQRISLLHI